MEEGAEQHHYVSQLRAEFDSCDVAAAGVLDGDGLVELCRRLQLEQQLPLLRDALLGAHTCARVGHCAHVCVCVWVSHHQKVNTCSTLYGHQGC